MRNFSKNGDNTMKKLLPILLLAPFFAIGCASQKSCCKKNALVPGATTRVRTTAYTHTEPGGAHNAIGTRLASAGVHSAAADWSRFPVGTKFKILNTGEICQIDDYGSALVGTGTIDLYKKSRGDMHNWGVRYVDIKILEWGSSQKSLQILRERTRNRHVRAMVADLRTQG